MEPPKAKSKDDEASKKAVISKVYYNIDGGFGSIAKTLLEARKVDPSIRREDVKAFLDNQEIRQTKKRRGDNSYIPFAPREEYQFDLADFGASAVKFRYAFVAIDAFSKMLDVVPIANKRPEECVRALNTILEKMHAPQYAYTDDGGEFKSAFEERLKYYFIEHIVTRAHAPFAERVIRTIREGLNARLTATRTDKTFWWKMLDPVVKQYNETKHVTTGEAPNDIHHLTMEEDKDWIEELRGRIEGKGHFNRKYPDIRVGDRVKIMRKPGKYSEFKSGFVAWSKETYKVEKVEYQGGDPVFYLEGRSTNPFRLHEILKVDGVEAPPSVRTKTKQVPKVFPSNAPSVIGAPAAPAAPAADPVVAPRTRLRQKTLPIQAPWAGPWVGAAVVTRPRLRQKTTPPQHPLADMIV